MLRIRDKQLRAFEQVVLDRFIRRIAADARDRLPGCCSRLSDTDLWTLCEQGVAAAATYGITDADDLPPFIDLVIAHGADFATRDAFGWAEPLLTDEALGGDVKVALLIERMPDPLKPETISRTRQATRGES